MKESKKWNYKQQMVLRDAVQGNYQLNSTSAQCVDFIQSLTNQQCVNSTINQSAMCKFNNSPISSVKLDN